MEAIKRELYGLLPATIDLDKNIGKAYAKLSELKNDWCEIDDGYFYEFSTKIADIANILFKVSELLSKFNKDTFRIC